MGKTLFVSDLDGTLLSSVSRVSQRSVQILNEAIGKGALFTIATARTPSTVEKLMKDVKANLPFIVMTGSAIWNPADGLFMESTVMLPDTAQRILDTVRSHNLPTFIYQLSEGKIHIYHTGTLSDNERNFISERSDSRYKIFHIPGNGESLVPEKLTNISVHIWQSKTECARKTTDFRTHLAKYGHSDKIMTMNREQEKNHCTTAKTGGIGCVVLQSS